MADERSTAVVGLLVSAANEVASLIEQGVEFSGAVLVLLGQNDPPQWAGLSIGCEPRTGAVALALAADDMDKGGLNFTMYPIGERNVISKIN